MAEMNIERRMVVGRVPDDDDERWGKVEIEAAGNK